MLARAAYSTLLRLLVPVYLLRLLWRGRAEPLYRFAWGQRLGFYADAPSSGWVWLHAVSLGETRAAQPLIQALRAHVPELRLLLTHTTATGREAGRALLRPGDVQVWLPLDTPGAMRRFLRHFSPRVGLLMETEVWPNAMQAAGAARVPMMLVNARLSEKSLRKGRRMAWLLGPAARGLTLALAQTEDDAARLRLMGVERVRTMGNLKFDVQPDAALIATGQAWRAVSERPVVVAASTREGEESGLLLAWSQALARWEALPADAVPRLLIVPRHPQRFDEVAQLVTARGLSLSRRSQWVDGAPDALARDAQVWLGDSVGEMPAYYAVARLALLGGSFAPLGGQNLIEAAACACPVVMGPHTFNFAQAAERALQAGAARRVQDVDQAVCVAMDLLRDAPSLARMASCAVAFTAQDRGAAQRAAQEIVSVM